MPAKFDLYSAWIDPYFYVWGLVFAAALFSLIYSMRRYLELKNSDEDAGASGEDEGGDPFGGEAPLPEPAAEAAVAAPAEEKTLVLPPSEQAWTPEAPEGQPYEQPVEQFAEQPAEQLEEQPAEQFEEQPVEQPLEQQAEEPAEQAPEEQPVYAQEEAPVAQPDHLDHSRAENFVRGIYAGINDLDERMKTIEEALSKSRINNDFAVKFLEDVLQDFDALDKSKIKARIEYLISDLKK